MVPVFSPDGRQIASASVVAKGPNDDATVKLWDVPAADQP
jgi:hypothetical protein